jgi:hypothetical protein
MNTKRYLITATLNGMTFKWYVWKRTKHQLALEYANAMMQVGHLPPEKQGEAAMRHLHLSSLEFRSFNVEEKYLFCNFLTRRGYEAVAMEVAEVTIPSIDYDAWHYEWGRKTFMKEYDLNFEVIAQVDGGKPHTERLASGVSMLSGSLIIT